MPWSGTRTKWPNALRGNRIRTSVSAGARLRRGPRPCALQRIAQGRLQDAAIGAAGAADGLPLEPPRDRLIAGLAAVGGVLFMVLRYALLLVLHFVLLAAMRATLTVVCLGAFVVAPQPAGAEEP